MTTPRFAIVPVMDHEIHVTEWGDPSNPPLILSHAMARTGRDFDEMACALSDSYYVLCPDMIGRGLSSWSANPEAEYSIEYYAGISADLLDVYGLENVSWLGTSMGGLIGMRLASGRDADRIKQLLINDIGPEVPKASIERILSYVGDLPRFAGYSAGEKWLRGAYHPFGPASDEFWHRMARTSLRRTATGDLTLHYDPAITIQFSASADELHSWHRWEQITAPTHVIRGASSDMLTAEIAAQMCDSGPKPQLTEFVGCGHAPSLSRNKDIQIIREILSAP
ncbi:alpha/beta fold hydrolase [Neptunicoccus cionae]|uniref:Hydrolase n=1 Tax=Neptunicoccus cionae TaxID=2035344 RepID=A0A916R1M5_9RHOB|nr:alpha/beta hydrolase [Amylibacter cionae]GGA26447.1 hydrolase [Amylibacter cionae]